MESEGWLYDGESAVRYEARIRRDGASLVVDLDDGRSLAVAPESLVHLESRGDCEVYGRDELPGWRLAVRDSAALAVSGAGRHSYGRWIDRIGLWKAAGLAILVSAAVLFAADRFPVWIAPYVPQAWEKNFGDTLVGDFGGKFCRGAGGQAALDKLARELSPGSAGLNVRVVDIKLVNAAALPGGNIVVFDELLSQADGPDEVAGVLAHEIAHIKRRHVTQAMIRQYGFSALIGAFGGSAGSNIDMIDSLHYSRGAEAEADADAIETLRRANISPVPTARFFDRLGRQEKKLGRLGAGLEYISTHPLTGEREQRFRASAVAGHAYRPALSRDEWEALADICRTGLAKP
jgi:Zn-dependent protease with chaperone function